MFPRKQFEGIFSLRISRGIFSLKNFRGNIFLKFPGEYFGGTSQVDIFVCRYRKLPKWFSPRSGGSGVSGGKIFPHSPQRRKYSLWEKVFLVEGIFLSLRNTFSLGNIYPFCKLFLFRKILILWENTLTWEHF